MCLAGLFPVLFRPLYIGMLCIVICFDGSVRYNVGVLLSILMMSFGQLVAGESTTLVQRKLQFAKRNFLGPVIHCDCLSVTIWC